MNNLVYNQYAIIEVTKEFTFDSCHQLKAYVGPCERLHGHTYKLQVTIEGVPDARGMVLDFKDLKASVNTLIVNELDHYNLNDKLDFNTTAENMVVCFYDYIDNFCESLSAETKRYIRVTKVRLWETPTSFATYSGRKCEPVPTDGGGNALC